MQLLVQPERVAAVLITAALLWPAGACGRPEPRSDEPVPEEEPGIPRLPSEFTNLEVLPTEITKDQLKSHMKRITKSLGVKCDHCHRTDIRDYATDEIREKVVARDMMRMVEQINREFFALDGAAQVTCFTCHHGEREPRMAAGSGVPVEGSEDL